MIQAQLADTQAQRAQLQASANDAVHALRTIEDDHRLGEQAVAAALDLAQDGRAWLALTSHAVLLKRRQQSHHAVAPDAKRTHSLLALN